MFGYTGLYKGKPITVFGSGMGQPSIGIYSYELFKFYGVENIIRIGSAGSYAKELDVYDTVLVTEAYSESTFAKVAFDIEGDKLPANPELLAAVEADVRAALDEKNNPKTNFFVHKELLSDIIGQHPKYKKFEEEMDFSFEFIENHYNITEN